MAPSVYDMAFSVRYGTQRVRHGCGVGNGPLVCTIWLSVWDVVLSVCDMVGVWKIALCVCDMAFSVGCVAFSVRYDILCGRWHSLSDMAFSVGCGIQFAIGHSVCGKWHAAFFRYFR